jgi:hypothetical protein
VSAVEPKENVEVKTEPTTISYTLTFDADEMHKFLTYMSEHLHGRGYNIAHNGEVASYLKRYLKTGKMNTTMKKEIEKFYKNR